MSRDNYLTCVRCRRFFHRLKNGVTVEEGMPAGADRPGEWQSYKLWAADLLQCEGCGAQILAGFSDRPIAEHYQPEYRATVERHAPLFRIDDCPGGPVRMLVARLGDRPHRCLVAGAECPWESRLD